MTQRRLLAARSEAERAQAAADVDALMAALQADASPRQSPVYRWLDARHDELLAGLGGQRVNWVAFAAHLSKLGLTDGKGAVVTGSVARNTWHRVKAAHSTGIMAGADGALSTGAPGPAPANQNDDEGGQQASSASPSTTELPAQEEDAAQNAPAPRGDDYPPGIRALTAPDSIGDSVTAAPDLPKHSPPAAPDHVPPPSSSEGEHHISESTSWTATFATKPSVDTLNRLRESGGKWDKKRACWTGASADDLISLDAAVRAVGGSFQVSPSAQPMT